MELQRILAKDSRSAMEQVHNTFGKDALVVSNKRARNKTELIVAVDLKADLEHALDDMQLEGEHTKEPTPEVCEEFNQVMESKIFKTSPDFFASENTPPSFLSDSSSDVMDDNRADDKRDQLHAREIVDLVKQELAVMRRELTLSDRLNSVGGKITNEAMQPFADALSHSGLSISLQVMVADLINQSRETEDAIGTISTILGNNISNVNILDDMQDVHVLSGRSGSGKTVTCARLARQKALEYGENAVAVISFKDSRFGAWSQIQILCSQAGVDTFRAKNNDELKNILEELSDRRLVIIDTSGSDAASSIKSLSNLLPEASYHLVLPADSSEGGVRSSISASQDIWESIIITRLDGDVQPWPIINVLVDQDIPVSLITNSPSLTKNAEATTGISLIDQSLRDLPMGFV
ncbi:MAG: DnaB-like helicase C-terminal domain-containing protein [Porticoccaceae bacterium]|nr:DnaB-like helicase C-terminal domain-containing protein [Porticoccaceae bacterium]